MSSRPASAVADAYPLSPMQEGILFHSVTADSALYVTDFACRLEGLDAELFKDAWQELVDRHDVLRTAFAWEGLDRPLQLVGRRAQLPLVEEDWRGLDPAEQRARFDGYLANESRRTLKLSRAPLMRLAFFRLTEDGYYFLFRHHHLILDGWSLSLLLEDLFAAYEAKRRSVPVALADRPPFRRYIRWLQDRDLAAAEDYWRRQLAGFAAPTPLGAEPGEARGVLEEATAHATRSLSAATTASLRSAAQRERVTLNTLMQGLWGHLLSRYSNRREVLFGVTVSGRPPELAGSEEALGVFINTLPLRWAAAGETPLWSALRDLQGEQAEMRRFEYTPLVKVQSWSDVPPEQPLFESLLVFENYPADGMAGESRIGSLRIREVLSNITVNYPLMLTVKPGPPLTLDLDFEPHRFEATEIARMLGHLQALLDAVARDPRPPVGELDLLGRVERHQLLAEWNDVPAGPLPRRPFLGLFEARAARTPDAVAVECGGRWVSYRQLDASAGRLAERIAAVGAGADRVVAVLADRGIEFLAAVLGIFKAGGAYLPLDPAQPPARLAQILERSAGRLLVAAERHLTAAERAVADPALSRLRLRLRALEPLLADAAPAGRVPGPASDPPPAADLEQLAYVIYTSGSTGVPKGAMLSQHGLLNHLQAKVDDLTLGAADGVAQTASQTFDISVWQFLSALTVGGRVHVYGDEVAKDPRRLLEKVAADRVTVLETVPSLLRVAIDELDAWRGRPPDLSALRWQIPTGEALPPELCRRWLEHFPGIPLLNAYGPTECSDDVTHHPLRRAPSSTAARVPIGRPVRGLRLFVLDRGLRPVPIGVAGELCVAGLGVGRGYLAERRRTAEVFVPCPVTSTPGDRLYRTGDLARRLPDGALDFLGRSDHQVKIHGFRIELREIEAVLCRRQEVREAVVVVRREATGARRLVAYLTAAGGPPPAVEGVRRALAAALPEYMVPAAFVWLDALPLTANGKVDRAALGRRPVTGGGLERSPGDASGAEPRTPAERTLAAIWGEVLGLERVGIHDSFLELGGDSILTLQVVSRARQAGLVLNPRQIFEHRTVAALAAVADRTPATGPSEQGPVVGPVPLTPIQRWHFEHHRVNPHHYNQALLLDLRRDGEAAPAPSGALLDRAMAHLLHHHDALRMRFDLERTVRQVAADADGESCFAVVDLAALPEAERRRALEAAAADLQAGLHLSRGPLLRTALFDLGSRGARLLMVCHHLVIDGVSWRILLDDLASAYRALAGGETVRLPAKTTSFKEWAEHLVELAGSTAVREDLDFWRNALGAGDRRPYRLPVDLPGGTDTVASTRVVTAALDAAETTSLLQEVPQVYRTEINDVLLTALVEALARWTGERRVILELEAHGREETAVEGVDLSRTVGWFTTLYPVCLDLRGVSAPGAALKSIKEQLRRVPRRGLSFGLLHQLGEPAARESLRALPRPEVLFNYLGQLDRVLGESLFAPAPEAAGPSVSPRERRTHLLEINASITGGCLQVRWAYSALLHRRDTVEALADGFLTSLRALLEHCRDPEAGGYTPSDFAQLEISQQELDDVVAEIAAGLES